MTAIKATVLQRPELTAGEYERRITEGRHRDFVALLRSSFPSIDPARYRGIQRNAVSESSKDTRDESAAPYVLRILGPDDYSVPSPRTLLPTFRNALELALGVLANVTLADVFGGHPPMLRIQAIFLAVAALQSGPSAVHSSASKLCASAT